MVNLRKRSKASTSRRPPTPSPSPPPSPQGPPPVAPLPGYDHIIFYDEAQKVRFISLASSEVLVTRFLNTKVMADIGMEPSLPLLFQGVGLGSLYGMCEATYRDLTLEFFSSYSFDDSSRTVSFRLRGVPFDNQSIDELCTTLGFGPSSYDQGKELLTDEYWLAFTGIPRSQFNVSQMKISSIQDPRVKVLFRTMAGTVFGRENTDKTNGSEAQIVGAYLDPGHQGSFVADIPAHLFYFFERVASQKHLKKICCGGIITNLARRLLPNLEAHANFPAIEMPVPTIDSHYLSVTTSWMKKRGGRLCWKVNNSLWLPLPLTIPPLVPRSTYLLDQSAVPRQPPQVTDFSAGAGGSAIPPQFAPPSGSFGGQGSAIPPHLVPNPSNFDPQGFENQRHNFEMVDFNLMQQFQLRFYLRENIVTEQDVRPSWHNANDPNDQTPIFDQYGVNRTDWGPDYHRSFGGAGGQYLAPPQYGGRGSRPFRQHRGGMGGHGGSYGGSHFGGASGSGHHQGDDDDGDGDDDNDADMEY